MQVDLSRYNSRSFDRGRPVLIELAWMVVSAIFFNHSLAVCSPLKGFLLRAFGAKIGRRVVIKPQVRIKFPWKLTIGNNTWIGEQAWLDNLAEVTIGANVCISQDAYVLTGNHNYETVGFDLQTTPVIIGDGAWIAARAVVCPGVRIGAHAVLCVASVASNDLESFCIYRGNPATRVRKRNITLDK